MMMDILMSETCWAQKKLNKISSDIKLVFQSSTIKYSIFIRKKNPAGFYLGAYFIAW